MNIAFFAIAISVLIGFAGLSADTGMIWITRARLQSSADAAVLAAAQELPAPDSATQSAVRTVACDYATTRNAVPGMVGNTGTCGGKADVTFPTSSNGSNGNKVQVKVYRTVQPVFGQVIGFGPTVVWAQATARIGSLASTCVFPFFVTANQVSNPSFFAPIKFTNANAAGAAIDVGGGANGVRDAMTRRTCSDASTVSVGGSVSTKPGALDQFKDGWDQITTNAATSSCPDKHVTTYLTHDAAGRYELSPTITFATCPRLVIVPILENGDYKGGNKSGKVIGFIPFYFALKCNSNSCNDPDVGALSKNDFWGYFVRLDVSGLKFTDYNGYGTQIVSLAD
jgi:hypothetical protein